MKKDPGEYDLVNGEVLLIDKAEDWTSFDVVNYLRSGLSRYLGIKRLKVGHAGTLDPMATGLLIVCTGKFTKRINELQDMDKTYTGTIFFGATTPSFDRESEPDAFYPLEHITDDMIHGICAKFTGELDQVPPLYSAIHIDGQRAYKLARKGGGNEITLPPRRITIHELSFTRIALPEADFVVRCSKGTYIRSLARDIGTALDSGAYLSALRRTAIGTFSVDNAMDAKDFLSLFQK